MATLLNEVTWMLQVPTDKTYSPVTIMDYISCIISSSGQEHSTELNIFNSYGQADYWWLRSPRSGGTGYTFHVRSNGGVDVNFDHGVVYSYGNSPSIDDIFTPTFAFWVNSYGYSGWYEQEVYDSYGINSPMSFYMLNGSFYINFEGNSSVSNGVSNSYGSSLR